MRSGKTASPQVKFELRFSFKFKFAVKFDAASAKIAVPKPPDLGSNFKIRGELICFYGSNSALPAKS
nr:hypothetical protein [uncultured Campylobacter sp.]